MEFAGFPKMPRLSREMVITEKLDGTNAQVCIQELDGWNSPHPACIFQTDGLALFAGSRTRWITPQDDNYGFARWCQEHAEELLHLGPGRHFGEWWGQGIQRGYDLKEKRFSLFNLGRWNGAQPDCCHVVPVLYRGIFNTDEVEHSLRRLAADGSCAAPGFMKPEGVIVFHTAGNFGMKKTLEKDEVPKGLVGE